MILIVFLNKKNHLYLVIYFLINTIRMNQCEQFKGKYYKEI